MSEIADRMQEACKEYLKTHNSVVCTGSIKYTAAEWEAANGEDGLRDQAGRGCAAACKCNDVVTMVVGDENGGTLMSRANDIDSHVPPPKNSSF